jgi:hypothetical protein
MLVDQRLYISLERFKFKIPPHNTSMPDKRGVADRMVKPPRGKAVLSAYVSEDLLKKVKEIAMAKYGRLHGALSYAVEEALRRWVWEELRGEQGNRIREVWSHVREYLETVQKYDFNFNHYVHVEDLSRALKAVVNADDKAVDGWLKAFEEVGILKRASPKMYELAIRF